MFSPRRRSKKAHSSSSSKSIRMPSSVVARFDAGAGGATGTCCVGAFGRSAAAGTGGGIVIGRVDVRAGVGAGADRRAAVGAGAGPGWAGGRAGGSGIVCAGGVARDTVWAMVRAGPVAGRCSGKPGSGRGALDEGRFAGPGLLPSKVPGTGSSTSSAASASSKSSAVGRFDWTGGGSTGGGSTGGGVNPPWSSKSSTLCARSPCRPACGNCSANV